MTFTTRDKQARCAALGFHPGPIDGIPGPRTRAAIAALMDHRGVSRVNDIFHGSGLHRIHWHWTAGAEGVIDLELNHYNFVIDHGGKPHEGVYSLRAQSGYSPERGAYHTWRANTGAIGLAVDCMAGAWERPFDPGTAPMTSAQLGALVDLSAELGMTHDIPVSRFSMLSHAEVQPTLGIRQKQKWDITWLPGMAKPGDPIEVGDRIRAMVRRKLEMKWAA
ncbi:MAG: peptidoglycan-binding protein [Ruegeria sp.]